MVVDLDATEKDVEGDELFDAEDPPRGVVVKLQLLSLGFRWSVCFLEAGRGCST